MARLKRKAGVDVLKPAKNYMTVDPSSRSVGVAIWREGELKPSGVYLLKPRKKNWLDSAIQIGQEIQALIIACDVEKVYCEMPAYMAGSHTTAAGGALVKLTTSAGIVAGICVSQFIPFEYVEICKWKGNLPKEEVIRRICKLYKFKNSKAAPYKADEWDAIGIGLYVQGEF